MVTKVARIHQKTKRPLNCGLSKVKVHGMGRLPLEEQIKNSIQPEAYECGYNKVREALIKAHPEDVNVFDYVMGLHYFYPCNMFATTWGVFDEYCQWLFSFIIPAACDIDVSGYNAYSKRVIGFFAERMMTVWVIKKKFKVEELPYITVE